jgi:hypothetical protein
MFAYLPFSYGEINVYQAIQTDQYRSFVSIFN